MSFVTRWPRFLLFTSAFLIAGALHAIKVPDRPANSVASREKARLHPAEANVPLTPQMLRERAGARPDAATEAILARWADAQRELGPRTLVYLDARTGGPVGVQPDGLPWIPGSGVNNRITPADFRARWGAPAALAAQGDIDGVDDAQLERVARDFMARHPNWFPVPQDQLVLQPWGAVTDPTAVARPVMFRQVVNGVPVEDALLLFSLNHGNLVSFGGQYLAPVAVATTPWIDEGSAYKSALLHAGADAASVVWRGKPVLKLIVVDDGRSGTGAGYAHRLVWEVSFRIAQFGETWRSEVDATSGEVVSLVDANQYANQIVGGVYPLSNDQSCPTGCEQPGTPMPYANTGLASPNNFTTTGGTYTAASGTVTTTLNGRLTRISDNCGAISASVTAPADMNLGVGQTATATDCTVPNPNIGGAGNTKSSRTAFFNVTKTKDEILGWTTGFNAGLTNWMNTYSVPVNVNINLTCNAFWTGGATGSLNMYRKAASTQCGNTGEIAMIFDHELGHGLDANDGGGSASPGEAYADDTAFLHHHDSCIGRGFFIDGSRCGGYGDACDTCTGVRDQDWVKHASNTPHTITNITGATGYKCATAACVGPCNRECHCEAMPIGESVWDAATIDLPHNAIPAGGGACVGTAPALTQSQAWNLMSRTFWRSVGTLASQYACTANTGGCGATTLFHLIKVQDDDNGVLTDGTPHASELQCAFGRHQTGCTTDNNTSSTSCPSIAQVVVSGTAGNGQVQLNWSTVANAANYRVFRNEEGCGAGYTLIATVANPTVTYTDSGLQNGRTYYYQVQAVGSNAVCEGAPSACNTQTPQPCTAPGTPTIGAVTVPGTNDLRVSWTNGAPASTNFNIYRATGTCAAPGPFTKVGNQIAASPYDDLTVSGGLTYAYKVAGTEATGLCESAQSGCAQNTATGNCLLPPTFAGATSATNSALSTCTIGLTWSAGTKQCPGASATVTYNVYRSTTNGFTPAVGNRIATGVTGTTYTDNTVISNGVTYYYVVRAVDSLGNEDTNLVQVSSAPTGATSILLNDTFEGALSGGGFDTAGWTKAIVTGTSAWTWSTAQSNSPTHSWFINDIATTGHATLTSPAFVPAANSTLTFYHTYAFESPNYDGGTLEYTTNAGGTWTVMPDANFTAGGFNVTISTGFSNPIGGLRAWGAGTVGTPTAVTVNLGSLAGQTVQLRWHEGNDSSAAATGWYIDSVNVSGSAVCTAGTTRPPEITSTGIPGAMVVSKGSSPDTVVLNFADMPGATGYNVYEGTGLPIVAGAYTHGTTGNLCAVATTLNSGRRSTIATGIGNAGTHYYLVTQFTAAEGPSGYDSNSVEIDATKNTCSP